MNSPPEIRRSIGAMPIGVQALVVAGRAPRPYTMDLTARTLQAAPELQPRLMSHMRDGPSGLARLMGLDEPLSGAVLQLWHDIQHEPVSARVAQVDPQLQADVFLTASYPMCRRATSANAA